MRSACTLIIMAKAPVMGSVKTRLAREVGAIEATRFYRTAVATVVRRLSRDTRWRTVLAVSPDTSLFAPCWPRGAARVPQGRGDLGQRMQRLLDMPRTGRVVLIGTDIPAVRPIHIARAFALLGSADVVLGPAADGGFWLVGTSRSRPVPRLFQEVPWSMPHTLRATVAGLAGRRVAFAATLDDVDTAIDLTSNTVAASRIVPAPR